MIRYAAAARRQLRDLGGHFERLERPEALRNLANALRAAEATILADPFAGQIAPRPYPTLRKPGRLWVRSGRYWIAYAPAPTPVILGVFHDTADIPGRA